MSTRKSSSSANSRSPRLYLSQSCAGTRVMTQPASTPTSAEHELALQKVERIAEILGRDRHGGGGDHDEPDQEERGREAEGDAVPGEGHALARANSVRHGRGVHARASERAHRGGEHLAPMVVVAKHVEARAGRRQEHGVARGARRPPRPPPRRAWSARVRWGTPPRARPRWPARPCRSSTACRTLLRKAAASGAKSWPLPSPPAISTSGPGMPDTAARVAPTLVPLESST